MKMSKKLYPVLLTKFRTYSRRTITVSDSVPHVPEEVTNTNEDGRDDGDDIEDPAFLGSGLGAEVDSSSESISSTRRSKKKSSTSQGKAKSIGTDKAKGKQKAKATHSLNSPAPAATSDPATCRSTAPTAAPSTSTRHVLPNPNIHHRHRPHPLFSGPTATATLAPASTSMPTAMLRVERLRHKPQLFAPNVTIPTNAYASSPLLTRRVGKAWGTGIGMGPLWQIVEDLGWFSEAEKLKPGALPGRQVSGEAPAVESASEQERVFDERMRRPRVYTDVAPPEGWAVPLCAECVFTFHS